jgi:hypothetical protein
MQRSVSLGRSQEHHAVPIQYVSVKLFHARATVACITDSGAQSDLECVEGLKLQKKSLFPSYPADERHQSLLEMSECSKVEIR